MIRSDMCDYNDAYVVAKGKTIVTAPDNNAQDKKLALKNNAPFISCILKINNTLIDNAETDGIITETNQIVALMVQVTTE